MRPSQKRSLVVSKMIPKPCLVCREPATFYIAYRNPMHPGDPMYGDKGYYPTDSAMSCDSHIAEVTAIILNRNRLVAVDGHSTVASEGKGE